MARPRSITRTRSIKPAFVQSESMGRISRDARLLFILLWTVCDDEGRSQASPRLLKGLLFPYDDCTAQEIDEWLSELEKDGCLRRYVVDGIHCMDIPEWTSYQNIHPSRFRPSKIPAFELWTALSVKTTALTTVMAAETTAITTVMAAETNNADQQTGLPLPGRQTGGGQTGDPLPLPPPYLGTKLGSRISKRSEALIDHSLDLSKDLKDLSINNINNFLVDDEEEIVVKGVGIGGDTRGGKEGEEKEEETKKSPAGKKRPSITQTMLERGSHLIIESIPDKWRAWAISEGVDPEAAFAEFYDYWIAVPGYRGRKLDWFATFRNSVRHGWDGRKYNGTPAKVAAGRPTRLGLSPRGQAVHDAAVQRFKQEYRIIEGETDEQK